MFLFLSTLHYISILHVHPQIKLADTEWRSILNWWQYLCSTMIFILILSMINMLPTINFKVLIIFLWEWRLHIHPPLGGWMCMNEFMGGHLKTLVIMLEKHYEFSLFTVSANKRKPLKWTKFSSRISEAETNWLFLHSVDKFLLIQI